MLSPFDDLQQKVLQAPLAMKSHIIIQKQDFPAYGSS